MALPTFRPYSYVALTSSGAIWSGKGSAEITTDGLSIIR